MQMFDNGTINKNEEAVMGRWIDLNGGDSNEFTNALWPHPSAWPAQIEREVGCRMRESEIIIVLIFFWSRSFKETVAAPLTLTK